MPTFEYTAIGPDGQRTNGRAYGASLEQVTTELKEKGLDVQRIGTAASAYDPLSANVAHSPATGTKETPSNAEGSGPVSFVSGPPVEARSYLATSVWGPLVGQVPLPRLLFFFRQFATMSNAGVPIVQSLHTLSNQAQNEKLARIIREMRGHVEAGRPPSAAMQRYPEVFSAVIVSLVRAGEEGGFADESYSLIADYLEREIEIRNLYKRVTFYPKLQIGASILIVLGANVIIGALGGTEKLASPLTNPITWIFLGPLIVFLFLFLRVGLANPRIKYNWDFVVLLVPGFGKVLRELAMAKFGRAFGALYRGGVPVNRALTLAADACGNEYLRARMYPAYRELEGGRGLFETFKATGAFSPIVLDMVHTGETTGNVDQMLGKMADYYEEEAATKSVQLGQAFGVFVGLCVAIYIGYIVITFYMGHYGGMMSGAG